MGVDLRGSLYLSSVVPLVGVSLRAVCPFSSFVLWASCTWVSVGVALCPIPLSGFGLDRFEGCQFACHLSLFLFRGSVELLGRVGRRGSLSLCSFVVQA